MAEASRLEAELAGVGVGLPSYDRLSQRYNAMATLELSYASALRLTPRANKESKIDGRDARRSNYPRPWEDPSPARPQKKPWDDYRRSRRLLEKRQGQKDAKAAND